MKSSTRIGAGIGVTLLGLLVVITPRFLFPVCEYHGIVMNMMGKISHMPCFYTANAEYIVGSLIMLTGIGALLSRGNESLRMLALVLAGAAVAVIVIPLLLPVCANPDEPCNHGTVPLLTVLGAMNLGVAGWMAFASRKANLPLRASAEAQS